MKKIFRINYTRISGENEFGESLHVKSDKMDLNIAIREICDDYYIEGKDRKEFTQNILDEDFADIGNRGAFSDVWWEELKPIIVHVSGGVVQNIENIPEYRRVEVHIHDDPQENSPIISSWE